MERNPGQCKIGQAVEYKVIVELDPVEETTAGGLILKPQMTQERELLRQTEGTIVSIGGDAFTDWKPPVPSIGDRVLFAVNAGLIKKGTDSREYRVIHDKDIVMIFSDGLKKEHIHIPPEDFETDREGFEAVNPLTCGAKTRSSHTQY